MSQPSNAELAKDWIDQHAHSSIEGQGGDDALYNAACVLYHGFDLGGGAVDLLRHYNATKCSPPWNDSRLEYKLKQAASAQQKHAAGGLARWMLRKRGFRTVTRGDREGQGADYVAQEPVRKDIKRIPFDLPFLKHYVRHVGPEIDAEWLVRHSPVPVENCGPVEFLKALYPKGERVLIFDKFYSQGDYAYTSHGRMWRLGRAPGILGVPSPLPRGGEDGVWFLNQPVSGEWHINPRATDKQGRPKKSRRSEESVTSWRYLVLESDEAPAALWIRLLAMLPEAIVAIYTSAGRSIHALVRVNADSKEWFDRYVKVQMPVLSKLGADPAAMTALRLTRLPGCYRAGKLQRLLYLNPDAQEGMPILWQEAVFAE